jgi:uncharacterized protein YlxP (DUF503 family)
LHALGLVLRLQLPDCRSPRDKAQRADAIVLRLRQAFNASIAPVGPEDPPSELLLAAVAVARHKAEARETLQHIADALAAHPEARLAAPPHWTDLRLKA